MIDAHTVELLVALLALWGRLEHRFTRMEERGEEIERRVNRLEEKLS